MKITHEVELTFEELESAINAYCWNVANLPALMVEFIYENRGTAYEPDTYLIGAKVTIAPGEAAIERSDEQ